MNDNINYLRKHAGLPLLEEVSGADITRALDRVQALADEDQLDESTYSTLKAILATVGQKDSKSHQTATVRAKKLPGTIQELYKETEAKEQLRLMYKRFMQIITELETIDAGTEKIQERDIEIRRWVDLFQRLISRVTVDLQARAGAAVAVKESIAEDDINYLLEQAASAKTTAKAIFSLMKTSGSSNEEVIGELLKIIAINDAIDSFDKETDNLDIFIKTNIDMIAERAAQIAYDYAKDIHHSAGSLTTAELISSIQTNERS